MSTADILCTMGAAGGCVATIALIIAAIAGDTGRVKTAIVFAMVGLVGVGSCGASLHACDVAADEAKCRE